jgi:outer membrane protein assembly factor BamB
MKLKIVKSIFVVLISGLLLTACAGGASIVNNWPGISANDKNAYLASGGNIYAVNLTNGAEVWRYPEKQEANKNFYAPPALKNDLLVTGSYNHELYGLDANTRVERWAFAKASNRWVASPLIIEDLIYAPNSDGTLYVLTLDGLLSWSVDIGGELWAQPATNGTLVFIPSLDHKLYAFDIASHVETWSVDLKGSLVNRVVLDEKGDLYIGNIAGQLFKIRADDGKILNETTLNAGIWTTPLILGDEIFLGDQKGNFYGIRLSNFEQHWVINTGAPVIASPIALEDGILYMNTEGNIVKLNNQGLEQWRQQVDGELYANAVMAGDKILIPIYRGENSIQTLLINGALSWVYKPEK